MRKTKKQESETEADQQLWMTGKNQQQSVSWLKHVEEDWKTGWEED